MIHQFGVNLQFITLLLVPTYKSRSFYKKKNIYILGSQVCNIYGRFGVNYYFMVKNFRVFALLALSPIEVSHEMLQNTLSTKVYVCKILFFTDEMFILTAESNVENYFPTFTHNLVPRAYCIYFKNQS